MPTNCKIIFDFGEHKEEFSATWQGDGFLECEDIADKIFFNSNTEVEKEFTNNNYPEMMVYLDEDPDIKSQVVFDDMAGIIYPSKTLEKAKKRKNKP